MPGVSSDLEGPRQDSRSLPSPQMPASRQDLCWYCQGQRSYSVTAVPAHRGPDQIGWAVPGTCWLHLGCREILSGSSKKGKLL